MSCSCNQEPKKKSNGRRGFLSILIGSIVALVGTFLAFPIITAMLEPVVGKNRKAWRTVGNSSDFKIGETKKVTFPNAKRYDWGSEISRSAAYIRRDKEDKWTAFSVNCSHLGCPVRWEETPKMFFCPCHGGAFYKDGSRAAGPPNRGLYTYPIRISEQKIELKTDAIPVTNITV